MVTPAFRTKRFLALNTKVILFHLVMDQAAPFSFVGVKLKPFLAVEVSLPFGELAELSFLTLWALYVCLFSNILLNQASTQAGFTDDGSVRRTSIDFASHYLFAD